LFYQRHKNHTELNRTVQLLVM